MVKLLSELAPAKINLFLRVTGRRSDGYHELDSIFVPISICDRVEIELHPSNTSSIALRCAAASIPAGEENLAFMAAREFIAEFDIKADVSIVLQKRIPPGAGLGGGSSDAASVLRMMASLCRIDQAERLTAVALRLGADVPFFLNPAPARIGGIGERITLLRPMARSHLLIAVPPFEVSTASIFRELRPEQWSGRAPDSDVLTIVEGRARDEHLVNDLEPIAISKWPRIGELKRFIKDAGARASAMTGSGGGVFGIFDSADDAVKAAEQVRRRSQDAHLFTASILLQAPRCE